MSSDEVISDKKKALLAYKDRLLNEIRDCEKRIDTVRLNQTQAYYDDEDSSDSDSGFPVPVDLGPSTKQLKIQTSELSVRLQATQELTSLNVLESEVAVLVTPPILENGPVSTPEGLWREVTAECRVDHVPFSIRFYVHQPDTRFAPATYHNLKVQAVKTAHDHELSKSVLAGVTKPSDAVQILRSYSAAHRARRTSLAHLADKYADALFMEPLAEGGYTIKCGDLLDISWTLQNKWSPIAPFHHRLKVEVDFLDEDYIRTIKQSHKLLMDPSLETDERTEILSKMIDTCLLVNQGISSAQESDFEQISPIKDIGKKRRTNLDEFTEPAAKKIKDLTNLTEINTAEKHRQTAYRMRDSEVMAPPKSLPKKARRASDGNSRDVKNSVGAKNYNSGANNVDSGANNGDTAKNVKIVTKNMTKDANLQAKSNTDVNKKDHTQKGVKNKENAPKSGAKNDEIATKSNVEKKNTVTVKKSVAKTTVNINKDANDKKNPTKAEKEIENGDSNENSEVVSKTVTDNKGKQPNVVTKKIVQKDEGKVQNNVKKVIKNVVKQTKPGEKLSKDGEKLTKAGEKLSKDGDKLTKPGEKLTMNVEELATAGEKLTKDVKLAKSVDAKKTDSKKTNENNKNVPNQEEVKKSADKTKTVENAKHPNLNTKKVIEDQKALKEKENLATGINKVKKNTEKVNQKAKSADLVKKPNVDGLKKTGNLKTVTNAKISSTKIKPNDNQPKVLTKVFQNSDANKKPAVMKNINIEKQKNTLTNKVADKIKTKIPLPQNIKMGANFGNTKALTKSKLPQKLTSINEKVKAFPNPVRMSPRTVKKPIPKTNSMFSL